MDERVVFAHSVEALLRALDAPGQAKLAPGIAALGIKTEALIPAYPLATYIALLDLMARELFPELANDDAYLEVGRAFMRGYGNTMMGKALMTLMRVAGPRRTLGRMTRNFRTANNYTECSVEPLGETAYRINVTYVLRPGFYQGIIETGLRIAGAKGPQVVLERADPDGRTLFRASWE